MYLGCWQQGESLLVLTLFCNDAVDPIFANLTRPTGSFGHTRKTLTDEDTLESYTSIQIQMQTKSELGNVRKVVSCAVLQHSLEGTAVICSCNEMRYVGVVVLFPEEGCKVVRNLMLVSTHTPDVHGLLIQ